VGFGPATKGLCGDDGFGFCGLSMSSHAQFSAPSRRASKSSPVASSLILSGTFSLAFSILPRFADRVGVLGPAIAFGGGFVGDRPRLRGVALTGVVAGEGTSLKNEASMSPIKEAMKSFSDMFSVMAA
jgi:hypothetical protein